MVKEELLYLVIEIMDELIHIYKGNKITYEVFLSNTRTKSHFLETCLKSSRNLYARKQIRRILSQYRGLVYCNNVVCKTQLLEDQSPY